MAYYAYFRDKNGNDVNDLVIEKLTNIGVTIINKNRIITNFSYIIVTNDNFKSIKIEYNNDKNPIELYYFIIKSLKISKTEFSFNIEDKNIIDIYLYYIKKGVSEVGRLYHNNIGISKWYFEIDNSEFKIKFTSFTKEIEKEIKIEDYHSIIKKIDTIIYFNPILYQNGYNAELLNTIFNYDIPETYKNALYLGLISVGYMKHNSLIGMINKFSIIQTDKYKLSAENVIKILLENKFIIYPNFGLDIKEIKNYAQLFNLNLNIELNKIVKISC